MIKMPSLLQYIKLLFKFYGGYILLSSAIVALFLAFLVWAVR